MKTAFLFPGQGAQSSGMGADIAQACPAAMAVYDRANEIVGYDLKELCFHGSEEKLAETEISQPAIFVTSAALLEALRSDPKTALIAPNVTAGLSLGEYTALYAAGILEFEDALRLVQQRGRAMQAAAEDSDGAMVSVLGLDEAQIAELCKEAALDQVLQPANFNCPGQIVISGQTEACRRAAELAGPFGAVKAIVLKVAGAFHTPMMQPAADTLRQVLNETPVREPDRIQVIANIDAGYYTGADQVRKGLVRQLIEPILWQKCMERLLADGVELFYEIGPGRVLTGLMKRIHRKAAVINVSSRETWQALSAKNEEKDN
ncbi:MAG: ACP S-malonyltransferase [Sedimentisphaerales bacterium]|nr:ACP S-malonyltransferase [Sedimentisphaerales bacterium]